MWTTRKSVTTTSNQPASACSRLLFLRTGKRKRRHVQGTIPFNSMRRTYRCRAYWRRNSVELGGVEARNSQPARAVPFLYPSRLTSAPKRHSLNGGERTPFFANILQGAFTAPFCGRFPRSCKAVPTRFRHLVGESTLQRYSPRHSRGSAGHILGCYP